MLRVVRTGGLAKLRVASWAKLVAVRVSVPAAKTAVPLSSVAPGSDGKPESRTGESFPPKLEKVTSSTTMPSTGVMSQFSPSLRVVDLNEPTIPIEVWVASSPMKSLPEALAKVSPPEVAVVLPRSPLPRSPAATTVCVGEMLPPEPLPVAEDASQPQSASGRALRRPFGNSSR